MSRVRVSELAKELGLETKAVIAQFSKLGVQVKNHLSMVSEGEVTKLKSALHPSGKSVTDKDASQKSGSKIFIRRKVDTPPVSILASPSSDAHAPEKEEQSTLPPPEESLVSTEVSAAVTLPLEPSACGSEKPETEPTPTLESADVNLTSVSPHVESSKPHQVESALTAVEEKQNTEASTDVSANNETLKPNELESSITLPLEPLASRPRPTEPALAKPLTDKSDVPSPAPATVRPTSSFSGATIVRRAPPQENVYQVNMTRPFRPSSPDSRFGPRPSSPDSRFGPRPSSPDNRFGPRPATSDNRFGPPRPAGVGPRPAVGQPQKSFVMSDALPSAPSKDGGGRFKDYNKEREKRRIIEENERNKQNRPKGMRFYENEDVAAVGLDEIDGALERAINVRTMVTPKKRKPNAFKRRESQTEVHSSNPTKASKKVIRIDEHISVNDLAGELSQKVGVVIKILMKLGMLATANKVLDFDTATLVAQEFGFEAQNVSVSLQDIIDQKHDKQQSTSVAASRPPIITIMGHVDHGKTSLLDALRSTNVVANEAGGITQHIGAYQIEYNGRKLTFLDTPGHEAFTAMRARGAKVTDIVILVVAADDGVMPQTIEAIAHAKAAGVPLIVAINKIDKPNTNIERITRELSEHGVISEEWGGDSIFVQVSAKTKKGLDQLIEAVLLQADVLELKAADTGFAEGVVIEAKRDKARGPVATVIITKGLLKQQESIVIGKTMGRVRMMYDSAGNALKEALPGMPVEIIGLDNVPDAGDAFNAVASDAIAREAVAYRVEKHRQAVLASHKSTSMDDLMVLFEQRDSPQKTLELHVIIKADTHGSAEAIKASLQKLDTQKVKTKVILAAVGGITETDIVLADASRALIIGFNVRPDKIAAARAESHGIKIMFFNIIYELIDAVKIAMVGTLTPIKQDKVIGHAEVRTLFTVPKIGVIAGSLITDGKFTRPCRLRVLRDNIVLYTGQLGSLKRFKDDAKEVVHGFECGIGVENYNDLKVGDVLEAFVVEEIAAEL